MKKTVILVIAVLQMCWLTGAKAQRPVGDTLFRVDPTLFYYIYDWHESNGIDWSISMDCRTLQNMGTGVGLTNPELEPDAANMSAGNVIYGVQMFTGRPLKIVGIATSAIRQETRDTTYGYGVPMYPNTWDTTLAGRITDSMILYKPVNGDLIKLTDAPWRIENPHRYIELPPRRYSWPGRWPEFIDSSATSYIAPLYEVMFEKPVIVEDSFVVAVTEFNNEGHSDWAYDQFDFPRWMWLWDHNPTRLFIFYVLLDNPVPECVYWSKFRTLPWATGRNPRTQSGQYKFMAPIIFPIIDPDFDTAIEHCRPVTNLRVAASTDTSATLIWDADNSIHWEVRYGMTGMDDSLYTSFIVTSPSATLTGLAPGVQYKAVVRGWCPCDSSWSDWTSKAFSVQQQQDIAQPGNLGRFTHLSPNPAHGSVSVVSSFQLSRIVLYDLSGRRMLEQEADGISATLDISSLAPGSYIAAIHTPHGVATKKLIVK